VVLGEAFASTRTDDLYCMHGYHVILAFILGETTRSYIYSKLCFESS